MFSKVAFGSRAAMEKLPAEQPSLLTKTSKLFITKLTQSFQERTRFPK